MAKGFFTQGISVLFDRTPSINELREALSGFDIVDEKSPSNEWSMGGPTLLVSFLPEVNGLISVDVTDRQWPDHMGDPKTEPMLFGSWSMGYFGPHAYPNNLARAVQQAWSWRDAENVVARHSSFVRVRSSYVFGGDPSAKVVPEDYDPTSELFFVTRIARAIQAIEGALCYFNPNGEAVRSSEQVDAALTRHAETGLLPLELWCNARFFNLGGQPPWHLLDTVGMWQLDAPDHEGCFDQSYDPSEVDRFLRNAGDYVLTNGPIIEDGNTMDGPGDIRWRAYKTESMSDPPRETLRWFPDDGTTPPEITSPTPVA